MDDTRADRATRRAGSALGPGVLVPSLRHVAAQAAAIATLEAPAPGRVAVAIGTGFTGRRLLGKPPLAWRAVAEYLRALRALLRGEEPIVDGAPLRLLHPEGFAPPRPIATPILVAANGPRGLEVARAHGDGVLALGRPAAGFAWCALARSGTLLEPGETLTSPRVFDALAPAIALVYHATYESAGAAVDQLPGGRAWREAIERVPAARWPGRSRCAMSRIAVFASSVSASGSTSRNGPAARLERRDVVAGQLACTACRGGAGSRISWNSNVGIARRSLRRPAALQRAERGRDPRGVAVRSHTRYSASASRSTIDSSSSKRGISLLSAPMWIGRLRVADEARVPVRGCRARAGSAPSRRDALVDGCGSRCTRSSNDLRAALALRGVDIGRAGLRVEHLDELVELVGLGSSTGFIAASLFASFVRPQNASPLGAFEERRASHARSP